jgi:hypothetical protein
MRLLWKMMKEDIVRGGLWDRGYSAAATGAIESRVSDGLALMFGDLEGGIGDNARPSTLCVVLVRYSLSLVANYHQEVNHMRGAFRDNVLFKQ